MNAYIYAADLHCEACACKIRDALRLAGKAPEDEQDEHTFDSDDFPKGPYADGGGESDSAQHCGSCGEYLENPLTSEGVEHVLKAIRESIEEAVTKGRAVAWDRIMPMKGTGEEDQTALAGLRHVEIVRGWASEIQGYCLEPDESALVSLFLELSKPV